MFTVHGLPRDPEGGGDRRPRPVLLAGMLHLQVLELLDEPSQRGHRSQARRGVAAGAAVDQVTDVRHPVSIG